MKGTFHKNISVRTREKELHSEQKSGEIDVSIKVMGDRLAEVSAIRSFKYWYSSREAGITIEAGATVKLTCSQDTATINLAGHEAGRLATELAVQGAESMHEFVKDFQDGQRSRS
jgi:hypothetical protein